MKLIVGLGNPGPRYALTRHNIGFRVVERLAAHHRVPLSQERFAGRFGTGRIAGQVVSLLEPLTFMNRSGAAVEAALAGLRLDAPDLLVVYDDVDLPLGRLRVRASGGSGGHRGLTDVVERLGRRDFARLRFGVGRPPPGTTTTDFVLTAFSQEEEALLAERVDEAVDALTCLLEHGVERTMNRYNAAP